MEDAANATWIGVRTCVCRVDVKRMRWVQRGGHCGQNVQGSRIEGNAWIDLCMARVVTKRSAVCEERGERQASHPATSGNR